MGGVSYSAEATEVFARMGSVPTNYKSVIATFIDTLVASGEWNNILELQLRKMNTIQNSMIGFKGVFDGSFFGALSGFSPGNHIDYDGVGDLTNTKYKAATHGGAIITQNDALYGIYIVHSDNVSSPRFAFGVIDRSGSTRAISMAEVNGTQSSHRTHQSAADTNSAEGVFDDDTWMFGQRTAAAITAMFKNGSSIDTGTDASTGLPTEEMYEAVVQNQGNLANFYDGKIGAMLWAKTALNKTTFVNAFTTLKNGLAALPAISVPNPYTSDIVIGIVAWGQSNELGSSAEAAPAYLQSTMNNFKIRTGVNTYASYNYATHLATFGYGPMVSFGYHMSRYYGSTVYCAQVAVGGAGLFNDGSSSDFNISTGELYPQLETAAIELQNYIINVLGKTPVIIQHVIQGEREANTGLTESQAWKTNMDAIQSALSTAGLVTSHGILGRLSGEQPAILDPANVAAVQACQDDFLAANSNWKLLTLTGLNVVADNIHYDSRSIVKIGQRSQEIMRDQILI